MDEFKDCRFHHFVGYVTEIILELNGKLPGYNEWKEFKLALDSVKIDTDYVSNVNEDLITVDQFRTFLTALILEKHGKLPSKYDWGLIKDMMDSVGPDQILISDKSASSYYNYGTTTSTYMAFSGTGSYTG